MAEPGHSGSSVLPVPVVAAQLLLIGWSAAMAADASPGMLAALTFAVGLASGIFGLLTAHELIHRRNRTLNALGMLMLTAVTYRHFRIAHLQGHHRRAVTACDPGTARLGESAYAFLLRSIVAQLGIAYGGGPDASRTARITRPYLLSADLLIYTLVYTSLAVAFGFRAALFETGQSLIAITVLGLFDYVAHYGLVRRQHPGGGYEPMSDLHSWNAEGRFANLLLLNMGRHSDHHRKPSQPYRRLVSISDTPLLPGGYAGAILTALVPPLWRRRMDKRAEHWARRAQGALLPDAGEHSARWPI
jgi:alkane 1-monooxygenase